MAQVSALSRRDLLLGLAGLGIAGWSASCDTQSRSKHSHPNLLMIGVDDLNDWVGFLGGHPQVQTPNLDALARRSIVFEHAYCHTAACHPSRTTVLTGALPTTTGIYANGDWMTTPFPDLPTIPAYLRDWGYTTLAAGKIFHESLLTPHPLGPAEVWDRYVPFSTPPGQDPFPPPNEAPWNGLTDGQTFHMSRPWIRQEDWSAVDRAPSEMPDGRVAHTAETWLRERYQKPFFMAIGFYRPHLPWYTPRRFFELYPESVARPGVLPNDLEDVPETARRLARGWGTAERLRAAGAETEATRAYLASVSFADWCVGRVLEALEGGPHRDDTWVIFWSDNGLHLGEKEHWHKGTLWERATRIPLLIAPPPADRLSPARYEAPVGLVDLYPTICQIADVPAPPHLEGHGLLDDSGEAVAQRPQPVRLFRGRGDRALRFQQWKYIRYADGMEELYDVLDDPYEFTNLASDPLYHRVLEDLRERLSV